MKLAVDERQTPLVEMRLICKKFSDDVLRLRDVSLSLESGELVCILGKSGVGKSTLLHILARLENPTSGNLSINGTVSFAPQRDLLLPWRTCLENVLLPLELCGAVNSGAVSKAKHLFLETGIADAYDRYPDELSGGMRQRVSFIRALLRESDLVLFDEAFSANDAHTRLSMTEMVRSQLRQDSRAGIFVTHSIEEAMALGDRVLVLSGSPAWINFEIKIELSEELRNPVSIRRWQRFGEVFGELWMALEGKDK